MRQLTILVDMDDTIENLTEAWIRYANARFGTDVDPQSVRTWDPSEAFVTVPHRAMYDLVLEEDLYRTVRPIPGAAEALLRLTEQGHRVYIVTNTEYQIARVKMEEVLFRYFPFLTWDQVIFCTKKQMIRGDVLIDDAPQNLLGGDYEKILFSAPHNTDFDAEAHGMTRVRGWDEAYAAVRALTEK